MCGCFVVKATDETLHHVGPDIEHSHKRRPATVQEKIEAKIDRCVDENVQSNFVFWLNNLPMDEFG